MGAGGEALTSRNPSEVLPLEFGVGFNRMDSSAVEQKGAAARGLVTMLKGVGTDIVDVDRIREMLRRFGSGFEERVFTPGEIAYCRRMRDPAVHFAGRFAAKEAVMKALGTGWSGGVGWRQVEVVSAGPPEVRLSGAAKAIAECAGGGPLRLSISHTAAYAVAVALLEAHPPGPARI